MRRWPTEEVGGLVLVWYGSGAPEYAVPPSDGFGDPEWTGFAHSMIRIRTQGREIVEHHSDRLHPFDSGGSSASRAQINTSIAVRAPFRAR